MARLISLLLCFNVILSPLFFAFNANTKCVPLAYMPPLAGLSGEVPFSSDCVRLAFCAWKIGQK